eukprot:jgi/Psemu1/318549/estExt_fgenesh1_pm.C_910005
MSYFHRFCLFSSRSLLTSDRPKTPQELLSPIPIGHPDSMMSKESVRRAVEEFHTRPTDVIVATFPKTGTTLVTWICHLLRTGACPKRSLCGFETLYEVVPWPTLSWDIGYDPNVQGSEFVPRVFKSHLRMASIYPGCKYVVTIRDPAKTALSFYNFFLAKKVPFLVPPPPDEDGNNNNNNNDDDDDDDNGGGQQPQPLMDVSTFLVDTPFVAGNHTRASIWEYYAEYHALLDCPSVLMLVYEDVVRDMASHTRTLAQFLNLPGTTNDIDSGNDIEVDIDIEALVARSVSMSTKEYMAKHMSKFDEPYQRAKALNRAGDVSQLAPGAKVALKKHDQSFDDRANRFLSDRWEATMKPLGYEDYDAFCSAVRKRNERWFGV